MSLWKVRVRCIHAPSKEKAKSRPGVCYEDCLVEADEDCLAMKLGEMFIEREAPCDVRWVEFMALSATKVQLPMSL